MLIPAIRPTSPYYSSPPTSSEIRPDAYQLFKHCVFSIAETPNCIRSHEIVLRAPEKTLSGSSLIAGIDKISIAICDSLGQAVRRSSASHQFNADDWIGIANSRV